MRLSKQFVVFSILATFCLCKTLKKIRKYDFIIVGGGTSGLTLARELSKNSKFTILILEAGPGLINNETRNNNSTNDWVYKTTDEKFVWHAGKGLGGTSKLGNRIYQPGAVQDYDDWSKNNPGWGYEDVKKYIYELEKNKTSQTKSNKTKGVFKVQQATVTTAGKTFAIGMYELGYRHVIRTTRNGYGYLHTYSNNNTQTTPSMEILQELQGQKNVVLRTDSYVTKIQVNSSTKWASAVLTEENGVLRRIVAQKEIILCAGVVGSSKILLLSGIGPQKDLQKLNIDLVVDLPVGKGVKDHISFPGLGYVTNFNTNQDTLNGTNGTNGAEVRGYISLGRDQISHRPDVEYLVFNKLLTNHFQNFTGISDDIYDNYFKGAKDLFGMYILPILLNPKSEGQIKLKSKNWKDAPLIKTNYLKEEEDLEILAESAWFVDKVLSQTLEFRKKAATLYPVSICPDETYKSREYWKCAVKKIHMSIGDYMGGCRMGPKNDNSSVVDNELRVYGLKNVRIADASVIPVSMSGHMEGPVIIVAKKAAELIKEEY